MSSSSGRAESTPTHPAAIELLSFFQAMHRWELAGIALWKELEAGTVRDESDWNARCQALRSDLAGIFERYCEVGAKAKRLSDLLHFGGQEPDYGAERETIQTILVERGDKVIIETQQEHSLRLRFRYEMVNVGGRWKIRDNRKARQDFQAKWHRHNL